MRSDVLRSEYIHCMCMYTKIMSRKKCTLTTAHRMCKHDRYERHKKDRAVLRNRSATMRSRASAIHVCTVVCVRIKKKTMDAHCPERSVPKFKKRDTQLTEKS